MAKQILIYLPVIHAGYENFFTRHRDVDEVLILGLSFASSFPVLRKEIRALTPDRAAAYVEHGELAGKVRVIEEHDLPDAVWAESVTLPDEDLTRAVAEKYKLADRGFIHFEPTFLRWDRVWSQVGKPVGWDHRVSTDDVAVHFTTLALIEARRSSDWWRQVGAVAVRDGEVLGVAHNLHCPSEYTPYIDGDPRNNFSRGVQPHLSTALHAEAAIIAQCALEGKSIRGSYLYVSTFPCPACARLIAAAGFARVYFAGPYALLHGDEILKAAGVELYFVDHEELLRYRTNTVAVS